MCMCVCARMQTCEGVHRERCLEESYSKANIVTTPTATSRGRLAVARPSFTQILCMENSVMCRWLCSVQKWINMQMGIHCDAQIQMFTSFPAFGSFHSTSGGRLGAKEREQDSLRVLGQRGCAPQRSLSSDLYSEQSILLWALQTESHHCDQISVGFGNLSH